MSFSISNPGGGSTNSLDGGSASSATQTMKQRRDTAANWTSNNPIMPAGVIGLETDTGLFKIGDGSTAWSSLIYYSPREMYGPSDANIASVSLLVNGDGQTNGSTTIIDNSPLHLACVASNGASITTISPKFNLGCLLFDGTNDYITCTSTTAFAFGTGDFTLEAWIRPNTISAGQAIMGNQNTGGADTDWAFTITSSGNLRLATTNTVIVTSTGTVAAGVWTHVACRRSGTSLSLYINGTQDGAVTNSFNFSSVNSCTIGAIALGANTYWNGRIDDVRVTKGVARTISVPTNAYPNY